MLHMYQSLPCSNVQRAAASSHLLFLSAAEALGAIEEVEFGDTMDVPDLSDVESASQLSPEAHWQDLIPGLLPFKESGANEKTTGYCKQEQDYNGKIKELETYLVMVRNIVKPGCSPEVLNVALGSMSSLVNLLSYMSSAPRPHSSL